MTLDSTDLPAFAVAEKWTVMYDFKPGRVFKIARLLGSERESVTRSTFASQQARE
ncbi:MAG TPA: hypothetical protein VJW76_03630 [Verrucomicrobiae bacterium]|nr:hypothetical protein [Verrucomicrobiae bacterium]